MIRETSGPTRWRVTARQLDMYRSRVYSGRVFSPEEAEEIRRIGVEMRRPKPAPVQPSNPGKGDRAPARPDKNPLMPPNPPGDPKKK